MLHDRFPNGWDRKYRNIVTQPHVDGIFASGLLSRIFDVPIRFGLVVRRAERSVILGMPVSKDAQIVQSFVIDIVDWERLYGTTLQTNFILCDNNYGSLTDLVVDVFDFEVPNDLLDAVYDVATRNVEENSLSEKLLLAWLSLKKDAYNDLASLVKVGSWDKILDWIQRTSGISLIDSIRITVQKLQDACQIVAPQIKVIPFSLKSIDETLAVKYLLYRLPAGTLMVVAIGHHEKRAKLCYISSGVYDLTVLAKFLEDAGYVTIARPNLIRIRVDENADSFVDKLTIALGSVFKHKRKK